MGDELEPLEFKMTTKKKFRNGNNNKRRFSEEQVGWLETMFKNESKLEPRQKAEVAAQLGLQPRQVAIWFQNKRARWKSRQLQHDFDALRRDHDTLSSRFHLLQRHNHSLSLQLQELKELTGDTQEQSYKVDDVANDRVSESNKGGNKKPCLWRDDEDPKKLYYGIGVEEEERRGDEVVGAMLEPSCSSLTSSDEEWHGLQSDGLFDQSPCSSHWWDFWP